MDSCAICGKPLYDYIVARQWTDQLPYATRFAGKGWRVSDHHTATGMVYCPDCRDIGRELDETLLTVFMGAAAEVQQAVAARARAQTTKE